MLFKKKTELGVRYEDGDVIARQGTDCSVVHVIQEGTVDVVLENEYGQEIIGEIGRGKAIGAVALLSRKPHIATFVAQGPVHIMSIDQQLFVRRLHEDPSFSYHLLEGFAEDIQLLRAEMDSLTELDPVTRAYSRCRYEHLVLKEMARCDRYGSDLSLMLLELPGLMGYAEAHGVRRSNEIIRQVAKIIDASLRISDTLIRWSEARFLVLLPGVVLGQAKEAAGRYIGLVTNNLTTEDGPMSLAGGVAQYQEGESPMSLVRKGLAGLDEARTEGPGRVRGSE